MKLAVWVLIAVALTGCASKVISSSPRSVVISADWATDSSIGEAQVLADKECGKHSRYARMSARPSPASPQFVFDCVQ